MRGAVLLGAGRTRTVECAAAPLSPRQVAVALEGSGVCASSLPVWEGRPWFEYPRPPGEPGHEGWGVVVDIGAEVTAVRPGDRVTVLSNHAFAEVDVADERVVVRLPSALDNQPVPGEPLACAVNAAERAAVRSGQWVIVVGIGFLGAVLTQLAAQAGGRVIAISRRPFARTLAMRRGAEIALPFDDASVLFDAVRRATGDDLAPIVIEATGTQEALDLATALVGVRGRLVIAGYHQDGPRQVDMQLWNWKGIDVINAHERADERYVAGMRTAVALLEQRAIELSSLLAPPVPLHQLDEAFERMRTRPDGFVKALVDVRR